MCVLIGQTVADGKPFTRVHRFAPGGDGLAIDPVTKCHAIDIGFDGRNRGVLVLIKAVEVDVDDRDGLDVEQPVVKIADHPNGEDQQGASGDAGFFDGSEKHEDLLVGAEAALSGRNSALLRHSPLRTVRANHSAHGSSLDELPYESRLNYRVVL